MANCTNCEKPIVGEGVKIQGEDRWVKNPEARRVFCNDECLSDYSERQNEADQASRSDA